MKWVPKSAVLAIHEMLLAEHGGTGGVLSEGALNAALANPRNLAASIVQNHPFVDGNKRVALVVTGVFLELNGSQLEASQADAVSAILALIEKQMTEAEFAVWLENNSRKARKRPRKGK